MKAGETILETETLRLAKDTDGSNFGILAHDGKPLFRFLLAPQWCNPGPLTMARAVLSAMQPQPPALNMAGRSRGMRGGLFCANNDSISLYRADEMRDDDVAGVLLHECVHATGIRSRLNRPRFAAAIPKEINPDDFSDVGPEFSSMELEQKQEELTASIGAMVLCVSLGIDPTGSGHWYRWMARAALVPSENLSVALRDAVRAGSFLLHDGDGDGELWCAQLL